MAIIIITLFPPTVTRRLGECMVCWRLVAGSRTFPRSVTVPIGTCAPCFHCSAVPGSGKTTANVELPAGFWVQNHNDNRTRFQALNDIQSYMLNNSRLGIPLDVIQETLHGGMDNGTIFPMPCSIGSTWNTNLTYQIGRVIGSEARLGGISRAFSPELQVRAHTPTTTAERLRVCAAFILLTIASVATLCILTGVTTSIAGGDGPSIWSHRGGIRGGPQARQRSGRVVCPWNDEWQQRRPPDIPGSHRGGHRSQTFCCLRVQWEGWVRVVIWYPLAVLPRLTTALVVQPRIMLPERKGVNHLKPLFQTPSIVFDAIAQMRTGLTCRI